MIGCHRPGGPDRSKPAIFHRKQKTGARLKNYVEHAAPIAAHRNYGEPGGTKSHSREKRVIGSHRAVELHLGKRLDFQLRPPAGAIEGNNTRRAEKQYTLVGAAPQAGNGTPAKQFAREP